MNSVNKRVVIIALIMALFTTFLIYVYIKKATVTQEVVEYADVYVAAKTLPSRHIMTEDDVKQIRIAREYLNNKAVLKKEEILGKRLKDRIIEGEQILRDRLVGEADITLAHSIPEGMRAVSINVDEQTVVANLVMPGDFVDVIASFDEEEKEMPGNTVIKYPKITKTIIQNVEVLSIGQKMSEEAEKKQEMPATVTLALTPQDVEKLVYASEYAVLRLALRPVGDDSNVGTNGTIRNDMVPEKGAVILTR